MGKSGREPGGIPGGSGGERRGSPERRPVRPRGNSATARGVLGLFAWSLLLALLWLGVLPRLAARPGTAAHLEELRRRKIDGGAMYYTELEAMEPILDRLNRRGRGP